MLCMSVCSCLRETWGHAGIACSMLIAELVYDVKARIILDSCVRAVTGWDIITSMIKAWVFGIIISVVSRTHDPWPPCLPLC